MTRAPAARANCSANIETPPVPSTSTLSPGRIGLPATMRPCHAVTAAQASDAPSSKLIQDGSATSPSSCRTIIFRQHAVDRGGTEGAAGPRLAFDPDLEKGRRDAVARLEAGDALPHRQDFAGPIGQRDDGLGSGRTGIDALHHSQIAKIQRGRADAHQNLPRAGHGIGPLDQGQARQTLRPVSDFICAHDACRSGLDEPRRPVGFFRIGSDAAVAVVARGWCRSGCGRRARSGWRC